MNAHKAWGEDFGVLLLNFHHITAGHVLLFSHTVVLLNDIEEGFIIASDRKVPRDKCDTEPLSVSPDAWPFATPWYTRDYEAASEHSRTTFCIGLDSMCPFLYFFEL